MAQEDKNSFSGAIKIRGHTLLCFQGFRGLGYSDVFVANMKALAEILRKNPETLIIPLIQPDDVCQACPNFKEGGCALHGPGTEVHMAAQDQDVLSRLELTPGKPVPWRVILEKIAKKIHGHDLPAICGNCPWLHLGYCAEGIDSLK